MWRDWVVRTGASLVVGLVSVQGQAPGHDPVTAWIDEHAVSVDRGAALDQPAGAEHFVGALGGARIVGLGEATHGTREFFQGKDRLIRHLVRELGFRTVAFELQTFKAMPLDAWVRGAGETTALDSLMRSCLSGIYQTEEVRDLLLWLRDFNHERPPSDQVGFVGFDVQSPEAAADSLRAILGRSDPEAGRRFAAALDATAPRDFHEAWIGYSERESAEKAALSAELAALEDWVARSSASWGSVEERRRARLAAWVLRQSDAIRSLPDSLQMTDANPRDAAMALRVAMLEEERPSGVILWAHNAHLACSADLGFRAMGSHLRARFGSGYYALGLLFAHGAFQAVDDASSDESMEPLEFRLSPPAAESALGRLAQAHAGDYLLDLRTLPSSSAVASDVSDPDVSELDVSEPDVSQPNVSKLSEVRSWFQRSQELPVIGASFSESWTESDYLVPTSLTESFDGIWFFEETTRARPWNLGE